MSQIAVAINHAWQHGSMSQWQHGSMHQNDAEMHHNGAKCTKTMQPNWHDTCSIRIKIICNSSLTH